MRNLSDWRVIVILTASFLGLLEVIVPRALMIRSYKKVGIKKVKIEFPFPQFSIFAGAILLTLLFPARWWSLTIGFIVSALAIFWLLDAINDKIKDRVKQKREDQTVQEDFQKWMSGEGATNRGNPTCPKCKTVYNRAVVVQLLKQQSPEIFQFSTWTTKFICKNCREEIVISGGRGE